MLSLEPSARPTATQALELLEAALLETERQTKQRDFTKVRVLPACFECDVSTASGGAYLEECSTFETEASGNYLEV
jgi:hypothetical protein